MKFDYDMPPCPFWGTYHTWCSLSFLDRWCGVWD
jgi:hypothetical protein